MSKSTMNSTQSDQDHPILAILTVRTKSLVNK